MNSKKYLAIKIDDSYKRSFYNRCNQIKVFHAEHEYLTIESEDYPKLVKYFYDSGYVLCEIVEQQTVEDLLSKFLLRIEQEKLVKQNEQERRKKRRDADKARREVQKFEQERANRLKRFQEILSSIEKTKKEEDGEMFASMLRSSLNNEALTKKIESEKTFSSNSTTTAYNAIATSKYE